MGAPRGVLVTSFRGFFDRKSPFYPPELDTAGLGEAADWSKMSALGPPCAGPASLSLPRKASTGAPSTLDRGWCTVAVACRPPSPSREILGCCGESAPKSLV